MAATGEAPADAARDYAARAQIRGFATRHRLPLPGVGALRTPRYGAVDGAGRRRPHATPALTTREVRFDWDGDLADAQRWFNFGELSIGADGRLLYESVHRPR